VQVATIHALTWPPLTGSCQRDHERMKAAGAEFKMSPTKVTGSTIAQANDSCGNLIQITQLNR
jgi:hypothetical protein